MTFLLSLIWCLSIFYFAARAIRQRDVLQAPARLEPVEAPPISIVVPARNEELNIGRCLRSLIAQHYPQQALFVVDDESIDQTASIVEGIARHHARVTLLRTPALQPGWKGKVNACCTGAAAAKAEWICFIDADVFAERGLLANAIKAAIEDDIDCLSLSPRHELRSFAERLMIPCGLYTISFSKDMAGAVNPEGNDVVVTGQFMLIRRAAYDAVGGHAAVCGAVCEDYELAQLLKQNGYRVALKDGTGLLTTRMYTGWADLWPGIAKNLVHTMGGVKKVIAIIVIAPLMAWPAVMLPILAAIQCNSGEGCLALLPALLGAAAVFAFHVAGSSYFRIPFWYGFLFPLGYSIGCVLALDSLRRKLAGRVEWKGRIYQ